MATITKTDKGYRAQVCVTMKPPLKPRRDSKMFRTKREAAAWASELEIKLHNGGQEESEPGVHTLGEAMSKYGEEISSTKRGESFELKRLAAWAKDPAFPSHMNIAEVEPDHIGAWRDARMKKVSAGSVLRDFNLLASVFEAARKEWRWIPSNPIRDVRKPRSPDHRTIIISRAQIRRMLEALGYHPRLPCRTVSQSVASAFLLALRTGMRAKEICELTHDRVKADYCILLETKTAPRNVPLIAKSKRIIDGMAGWDDALVFGLKSQTLDAMFRKYRNRAGMDGEFTFHDARHTAATWLSRKVDVLTLCKIFGWKNTSQALTYFNPTASDITRLIEGK